MKKTLIITITPAIPIIAVWAICFFHRWTGLELGFHQWYTLPLLATYGVIFGWAITLAIHICEKAKDPDGEPESKTPKSDW